MVSHIQRHGPGAVDILVAVDSDERIATLEKASLKTDHHILYICSMSPNVICHSRDVNVVQRRIYLIQHEKRSRAIAVEL